MRILGIDYGTKNIGFAVGEDGATMEIKSLRTSDFNTILSYIKKIINEERIDLVVLGIPYNKNNKQKEITEKFGEEIKSAINVKVIYINETNTSKDSFKEEYTKFSDIKKIKKKLHSRSAEKIIKNYWDSD